jgi:5'(3')-deoxyribonucleotidase
MKRLYIDMDNVLCDYNAAFRAQHSDEIPYPQSRYGFFISLLPLPHAIQSFFDLSKHFDIWILTAPSVKNPLCYTEKRVWVERELGFDVCHRLIICSDKSLLKGHFLVDDSSTRGQREFEGEWIHFGSDKFPGWLETKKYLMSKR